MLFILAVCLAIIVGYLANQAASTWKDLPRWAATIAGVIVGFAGTYYIAALLAR